MPHDLLRWTVASGLLCLVMDQTSNYRWGLLKSATLYAVFKEGISSSKILFLKTNGAKLV